MKEPIPDLGWGNPAKVEAIEMAPEAEFEMGLFEWPRWLKWLGKWLDTRRND